MPPLYQKELFNDHLNQLGCLRPIIILDWDDTILSSSSLLALGVSLNCDLLNVPADVLSELRHLESCAIRAIFVAKELGDLCIVTNSELGWVERSAKKFLPGVYDALSNIPVISARHHFEQRNPNNPTMWKFDAFYGLLTSFPLAPRHVISFGDSLADREAILAASKHVQGCIVKHLKFAEKPTIQQLVHQLEYAARHLPSLVEHAGHLDLIFKSDDSLQLQLEAF